MEFYDFDLEDAVLDGLEAMNFSQPTPIQEAAIPALLEGRDLLGCAQTGTGKTAAYLLPIINRIHLGEFPDGAVNAIVMAPTRELAQQIDQQIEGFGYYVSLSSTAIYGGTDGIVWAQAQRSLEKGTDIIVATPGRLLSMLHLKSADISRTSYFVIDEADRMLDMGFYDDIMSICRQLPSNCQIVLFSATMPPKIAALANAILKNPVRVELAISKPPTSIHQYAALCRDEQKIPIVKEIISNGLGTERKMKTVIFSSSKLMVHQLSMALKRGHLDVAEMHSDLDQQKRESVMRRFKSGEVSILVATDIVARGIDIDDIELVINFDMPRDSEDYVHRIGRTARGTSDEGWALTLVNERNYPSFVALEQFLGYEIARLPHKPEWGELPVFDLSKSSSSKGKKKKGFRFGKKKEGEKRPKHSSKPQLSHTENSTPILSETKERKGKKSFSQNRRKKRTTTQ